MLKIFAEKISNLSRNIGNIAALLMLRQNAISLTVCLRGGTKFRYLSTGYSSSWEVFCVN